MFPHYIIRASIKANEYDTTLFNPVIEGKSFSGKKKRNLVYLPQWTSQTLKQTFGSSKNYEPNSKKEMYCIIIENSIFNA